MPRWGLRCLPACRLPLAESESSRLSHWAGTRSTIHESRQSGRPSIGPKNISPPTSCGTAGTEILLIDSDLRSQVDSPSLLIDDTLARLRTILEVWSRDIEAAQYEVTADSYLDARLTRLECGAYQSERHRVCVTRMSVLQLFTHDISTRHLLAQILHFTRPTEALFAAGQDTRIYKLPVLRIAVKVPKGLSLKEGPSCPGGKP